MGFVWQSYGKKAYIILTLADFPRYSLYFTAFFAEKSFFCDKMTLLARGLFENRQTEKSEDGNPQPGIHNAGAWWTAEKENKLIRNIN